MVKPLVSGEDFPTNRMKLGSFFQMKLVGYAVVRSCTQLHAVAIEKPTPHMVFFRQ